MIRFYANACVQVEVGGANILCDPWLTEGAFDGSWFHDPPLATRPEGVVGYTHIYISHIHSDHFDPSSLVRLPYRAPVVVCAEGTPALRRQVEGLGFPVIALASGEELALEGAVLTMLGPFTANPLWPSEVPNIIDSAIVVRGDGRVIFNANDNTPDMAACRMLVNRFGTFDVALLPYSGASEYPSCFAAIDQAAGAEAKIARYLHRLEENVRALRPVCVVPFAGQYRLAGRLGTKNPYLGVPAIDRAAQHVEAAGSRAVVLNEGDELDLSTGHVERAELIAPRPAEPERYWYEESFSFPTSDHRIDLLPLVKAARVTLRRYQERFGWATGHRLQLRVVDGPAFLLDFSTDEVRATADDPEPPYTSIAVTYGLLLALLTRHVHWNNAAIGGHLEFSREPEIYVPEVFTLLSFLHV